MEETLTLKVEIDPEFQKSLRQFEQELKRANTNSPKHPINQDNSRFIALVSRIETLEAEVAKLRNEVQNQEEPEDFSYDIRSINRELEDLEERVETLEKAHG